MNIIPCRGCTAEAGTGWITLRWDGYAQLADYPWIWACLLSGQGDSLSLGNPVRRQMRDHDRLELPLAPGPGQRILRRQRLAVFCADGGNGEAFSREALLSEIRDKPEQYITSVVIGPNAKVQYKLRERSCPQSKDLKLVHMETYASAEVSRDLLRYGYELNGAAVRYSFPTDIPQGKKEWQQVYIPTEARLRLYTEMAGGRIAVDKSEPKLMDKLRSLLG